jgi:hypothetical protein
LWNPTWTKPVSISWIFTLNPGTNHFATFNLQPYPFVGCGVHIQNLPSLEISSELWAKQMGFSGAIHKAMVYELLK